MTKAQPEAAPVSLRWWGWTDVGRVRKNNEDAFLGLQFDAHEVHHLGRLGEAPTDHADFAFAVSDGMGGANAGEVASRITVEKITALLPRAYHQSARGLSAGVGDVMTELFERVHKSLALVGGSYEECRGMEATLSLCWFSPGWMYFGHIGDSRVYYLPAREGGMRQLTHDDTHVGWLLRNGKINEREARSHPRRNVLQKSLGGSNQFVDPQVGAVAHERGDVFLLCTDGLTDGLYEHAVLDVLRPPPGAPVLAGPDANPARRLVQASVEQSGRDNTTALVIEVW
ncbi:MAG: hypothetical protein RJA22_1676 [Verrucomicrobiota bacterium]|jgi:protein phosphatase